jgi:hypothetical protein
LFGTLHARFVLSAQQSLLAVHCSPSPLFGVHDLHFLPFFASTALPVETMLIAAIAAPPSAVASAVRRERLPAPRISPSNQVLLTVGPLSPDLVHTAASQLAAS